ncbi:MAG TPA: hypothetical protein VN622_16085 [Clostridia bacterium]|nr:hypothetical protein [Clostridia bacterium]
MKVRIVLSALLLACGIMFAQSNQSPQPSGQSAGTSTGMKMGAAQGAHGMTGKSAHMQQMQAEMQQMKSRVEKMRADAEKVQDPNTKAALLDNAEMWEQFTTRMQSHMDMMMKDGGMHRGGMMSGQKGMKRRQTSQPPQSGQTGAPNPK